MAAGSLQRYEDRKINFGSRIVLRDIIFSEAVVLLDEIAVPAYVGAGGGISGGVCIRIIGFDDLMPGRLGMDMQCRTVTAEDTVRIQQALVNGRDDTECIE